MRAGGHGSPPAAVLDKCGQHWISGVHSRGATVEIPECFRGAVYAYGFFFVVVINSHCSTSCSLCPPQFNQCHGHYHSRDSMRYTLLSGDGKREIMSGGKKSYCIEDSNSIPGWQSPNMPCVGRATCDEQGLQIGWLDVYGPALDCQWLDITSVSPGKYILRQCLNPLRSLVEASYENVRSNRPGGACLPLPHCYSSLLFV